MKKSTQLYLITLSVVIAIIAVYIDNKMLHYIFKPVSTLLIILIPILFTRSNLGRYKNSILIGLVCCLVGDILLMFDSYFIFGLVSFLIGHAFFIYSFSIINGFTFKIKTLIPLMIVAGFVFINLKDHLGELLIPVLLYITCIVLMAWQAINLYVWKKEYGFLLISIGACLFLVSDSILAYAKFIHNFNLSPILVLGTYWTAITLISLSTIYINDKSKEKF